MLKLLASADGLRRFVLLVEVLDLVGLAEFIEVALELGLTFLFSLHAEDVVDLVLVAFELAVVLFGQHEDGNAVVFGNDFGDFADLDLADCLGEVGALGLGEELIHDTAGLLGFLVVAIDGSELGERGLFSTNLGCKTLQHILGIVDFLSALALGGNEDAGTADGIVDGDLGLVEFPESLELLFGRSFWIRDLLFENLFALELVFDLGLELSHGRIGLLEFLLESVFARELLLEEGGQAIDFGCRDLDTHLLGFELDEFLADEVVDNGIAKLSHHFISQLLARSLLGTKHRCKTINFTCRNTGLFDADDIHAFRIQQLSRGDSSCKEHCSGATRNDFKRHYSSLLKNFKVNIENLSPANGYWM